jgi:hypothetical protein
MRLRSLITALAVIAFIWAGVSLSAIGTASPSVQPPEASSSILSEPAVLQPAPDALPLGDRAWVVARVLAVDIGSRPAGSEAERRAASYLSQTLTDMGYAVDVVPFDFSGRTISGTSQNVVARSPSEDPNAPLVIVGGHYDSVPAGPGANDNASGSATMIEVARDLAVAPAPGLAIRYIAFGAEEIGLLGSKDYVAKLSDADRARVKLFINLDMLAVGDEPQFAGTEEWVFEAMARAASAGYSPRDISRGARGMSDHQSFLDAGIPAIMFHAEEDNAYHTERDVIERLQRDLLDLMGHIAVGLIRVVSG